VNALVVVKLIVDIVEVATRAYGEVADRKLARENQERDEKIRELERQVEKLKRARRRQRRRENENDNT
jgi:hypothetical protein